MNENFTTLKTAIGEIDPQFKYTEGKDSQDLD